MPRPSSLAWLFDTKNLPAVGSWSYAHTNLHAHGAQFCFLDGRAAAFPARAWRDLKTGALATNNPALRWFP